MFAGLELFDDTEESFGGGFDLGPAAPIEGFFRAVQILDHIKTARPQIVFEKVLPACDLIERIVTAIVDDDLKFRFDAAEQFWIRLIALMRNPSISPRFTNGHIVVIAKKINRVNIGTPVIERIPHQKAGAFEASNFHQRKKVVWNMGRVMRDIPVGEFVGPKFHGQDFQRLKFFWIGDGIHKLNSYPAFRHDVFFVQMRVFWTEPNLGRDDNFVRVFIQPRGPP